MSQFLTNAELLKGRLDAHFAALGEGWEGIGTVVYRQKDIESEADAILAKAGGAAITILWDGFEMANPNSRIPDVTIRYSLAIWSLPTAESEQPAAFADDVAEQVLRAVNGWTAESRHCHLEFRIGGGNLVPHPTYLIYDLSCTIKALIV